MPDPDKTYKLIDPDGGTAYRKGADLDIALAQGYTQATPAGDVAQYQEDSKAQFFNSPEQLGTTAAEHFLGGATFGGTDLLDRFTKSDGQLDEKRAREQYNPGVAAVSSGLGMLGAGLATGGLAAGAKEGISSALGNGLGARLAAKAGVEAAEGMAYGVGQGLSNLSISTTPTTGESIAEELIKNGLFGTGAGFLGGVAGGVVGETAGAISRGLDSRAAGKAVEAMTKAAKGPISVGGLDKEAATTFTQKLSTGFSEAEEAAKNAAAAAESPLTPKDLIYSARASRQMFEDTKGLIDPKTVAPELAKMKKAQQALGDMFNGFNDGLDRPDILDAGGLKMLTDHPELYDQAAKHLDDWRQAAADISEKAGMGRELTGAKFIQETPEQLQARLGSVGDTVDGLRGSIPDKLHDKIQNALDKAVDEVDHGKLRTKLKKVEDMLVDATAKHPEPYIPTTSAGKMEMTGESLAGTDPHRRIQAVAEGKLKSTHMSAEVPAAMEEINTAATALNESWGLKAGSKLDENAINKFLALPADKAIEASTAFSKYIDTLGGFSSKFDDGAAAAKHAGGVGRIQEALGMLKQSPAGVGAPGSTAELFAGIAGIPVDAVKVSGTADDMLKLWTSSRIQQGGAGIVPKAASGLKGIKDALLGAAKEAGYGALEGGAMAAATGHDPISGAMYGAGLSGRGIAKKLFSAVKSSARLSQIAGATTARMARATELLAKGATHSRLTAPTALAVLNAYTFGEDAKQGKNLQEAYAHRLDELAQIAGNPLAAHKRLNDNLTDLRKLNFQLADDNEMLAMRDAKFFLDKAPKDPGTMNRFGKPTWRPSDSEIMKWSNHFRVYDLPGVWERAVSGRMTPQEAEALRTLRPETFKALQQQITDNLPEIQKNATPDQRVRISIFSGVPADSRMLKRNVDFVQQQFAERAGPDSKPVDLNAKAFKTNQPTDAQKL